MNENLKGYYLNKTGDRVKQLLDRQFIVPTLDSIPNSQTKTWQDGEYTVAFRIGELCRVKVNGEWEFYRLHDIVNNLRVWQKANAAEIPDLSDYYTKTEVDTKIQEHTPDLSNYYTKGQVDDKINEYKPDLTDYYTKEQVNDEIEQCLDEYYTKQEVDFEIQSYKPDLSDYYTKGQVHQEIENAQPDLTPYATKDNLKDAIEAIPPTDLSDYPTRNEVSETVDLAISSIQFPEDESIKNITQEEYDALFEADGLSDKTLYFVSKEDYPVALYIGKILIAQREEGSKGFAYNFPIIF